VEIPSCGSDDDYIFSGHKKLFFQQFIDSIDFHFKMNQQMYNLHTGIPIV